MSVRLLRSRLNADGATLTLGLCKQPSSSAQRTADDTPHAGANAT